MNSRVVFYTVVWLLFLMNSVPLYSTQLLDIRKGGEETQEILNALNYRVAKPFQSSPKQWRTKSFTKPDDLVAQNPPGSSQPKSTVASCAQADTLRSQSSAKRALMRFRNLSKEVVNIYRISDAGSRKFTKKLQPDEEYVQRTYFRHPWLVENESGKCLAIFVASTLIGEATIAAANITVRPDSTRNFSEETTTNSGEVEIGPSRTAEVNVLDASSSSEPAPPDDIFAQAARIADFDGTNVTLKNTLPRLDEISYEDARTQISDLSDFVSHLSTTEMHTFKQKLLPDDNMRNRVIPIVSASDHEFLVQWIDRYGASRTPLLKWYVDSFRTNGFMMELLYTAHDIVMLRGTTLSPNSAPIHTSRLTESTDSTGKGTRTESAASTQPATPTEEVSNNQPKTLPKEAPEKHICCINNKSSLVQITECVGPKMQLPFRPRKATVKVPSTVDLRDQAIAAKLVHAAREFVWKECPRESGVASTDLSGVSVILIQDDAVAVEALSERGHLPEIHGKYKAPRMLLIEEDQRIARLAIEKREKERQAAEQRRQEALEARRQAHRKMMETGIAEFKMLRQKHCENGRQAITTQILPDHSIEVARDYFKRMVDCLTLGHAKVTHFEKVNAQRREIFGVEIYDFIYRSEVQYTKDVWTMDGKAVFVDEGDYWSKFAKKKQFAGETKGYTGSIVFEKMEKGWRAKLQ